MTRRASAAAAWAATEVHAVLAVAEPRSPSSYVSLADTHPACTPANDHRYPNAHRPTHARAQGSKLYEEFHPFGTTAYAANDSGIEVSAKRYRYIGKERDEETGLYHCGARYLAAWLGRWTAADPIGLGDGVNRYAYARNNPVNFVDPGGTKRRPPRETPEQTVQRLDAQRGPATEEQFGIKPGQPKRTRKKGKKADEDVGRGKGGKGSQPPAAPEPAPPPPTPPSTPGGEPGGPSGEPGAPPGGEPGGTGGTGATALEEAAALAAVLAGEEVEFGQGKTRMGGLKGGLAPEGTQASAGLVLFTLIVREAFYAAAFGVAGRVVGKASSILRRVGLDTLAGKLDELADAFRAARSDIQSANQRHLLERARMLGEDPVQGFKRLEGLGGVRIELKLGRPIERSSDPDSDFVDEVLGAISLKGPIEPRGSAEGLAKAAVKDATVNTATKALFVDLSNLAKQEAAVVRSMILKETRGRAIKKIFFLD